VTATDVWVWITLGVLFALIGIRALVVETGHATLGRTPVRVRVLTGACALVASLVVGLVTFDGGARLVWLVLHPKEALALEEAANAQNDVTTAPPTPGAPAPGQPAAPAAPAPAPPR
jgi:hypothetical protein